MDNKVKHAIEYLDQLIQQLGDYKPLLHQNVTCAEFELRAHFTSLMDFFNERQNDLLKQLNDISKEKSMLIDSHKQTLESLRAAIISSLSSKNDADSKFVDYINKAESFTLSPNLTPFVTFRAEASSLKQAVSSYGRLGSKYPGHFADPSQPSACLPRAIEEEDDHDINTSQSTMFGRTCTCSCVNPDLQSWLPLTDCRCNNNVRPSTTVETKSLSLLPSLTNISYGLKDPTLMPPRSSLCSQSSMTIPPYQTNSSTVLNWLELQNDQKTTYCDSLKASDSFDILTHSTRRSVELQNWLFSDPAELGDMPGLSTVNVDQINQKWLTSQIDNPSLANNLRCQLSLDDKLSKPLLPAYLSNEAPLDLQRWLRPQSKHDSNESVNKMEVLNNSIVVTSENDEITSFHPNTNSSKFCPLYGQCQGGPGGPTCCGGSLGICPNTVHVNSDSHNFKNPIHSSFPLTTKVEQSSVTVSDNDSSQEGQTNESHSLIIQLDRIATSDLKQWITSTECESYENRTPTVYDISPRQSQIIRSICMESPKQTKSWVICRDNLLTDSHRDLKYARGSSQSSFVQNHDQQLDDCNNSWDYLKELVNPKSFQKS